MALFGNIDDSYTSTGKGMFGRWSNTLSFFPKLIRDIGGGENGFLRKIPFIGGSITAVLGYIDTIYEAGQWLFKGQVGSAATVLATGAVATTVNAASDTVAWWVNGASSLTTGASVGTHARAGTEALIGMVTGALGVKPQVLSSYPAGIGSIGGGAAPAGPAKAGKFASNVSAERNQNADEAYARYMSGEGGVHVNELQSAYGRGA